MSDKLQFVVTLVSVTMNEWEWQLLEDKTILDVVRFDGKQFKRGDRVRLNPRVRGDVFDLALAGKTAVIEAIEEDYEGNTHLAVVLDDDPGRDLGMLRQPGHRFFFQSRRSSRCQKQTKV